MNPNPSGTDALGHGLTPAEYAAEMADMDTGTWGTTSPPREFGPYVG